ncbi:MAG: type II toxin-antitoxin system VapC family toxin [Candidatus Hydrogenedentes bacterium]|nr:type II toxin-antitoxin system VapC family toxin [Candidatus Hydrogenedentota bacterium]
MILVDANILIYAHVEGMGAHVKARDWLDGRLNGNALVGLPWPSLLAFMRLVTNPRVFDSPESAAEAWDQVAQWLNCETVWIPQPTPRHAGLLGALVAQSAVHANLIPDAHLAALAIEHGLTLCTTDGDFARFQGLRWENPLRSER